MADNLPAGANPYIGPRTFTREDRERFFGREREARELLSLVISQRLVLFYAQSGAGKSSLINTCLAPQLGEEGFVVLPVARVGGELPAGVAAVDNVFLFNLMLSLDRGQCDPNRLAHLGLADFLARLTSDDGEHYYYEETLETARPAAPVADQPPVGEDYAEPNYVLIVDQFEEIFTTHLGRWRERAAFFAQLDQAMAADPRLWVVLTLREDYVAGLDPYAPLLTDKLRARYYMERMGKDAALDAIRCPAELGGRPFAPGVAEQLVDNLRLVRVPGQEAPIPGQYVEPVQLQVVCYQLWENLGKGTEETEGTEITLDDLAEAGDVNRALTQFYEETLAAALADPAAAGVSERQLRTWFDEELITEAGTRGLVHQGEQATGSLPNAVVRTLQGRFLVRGETRSGDTWIELVHDRFVEPIRASNAAWFPQHLSALQRQAALWTEQGRSSGLLLRDAALAEAEAWAAAHPDELASHEQQFLAACQEARVAAERTRRQTRRIRALAVGAVAFGIVAALMAWIAVHQLTLANQARQEAQTAQAKAEKESRRALSAESMATARLLVTQGEAMFDMHPLLGLRLALEGWRIAPEEAKESILRSAEAMASRGRIAQFGRPGIQQVYGDMHVPFLVVDFEHAPGQLRWPTGKVITLTDEMPNQVGATFSPDGTYFILHYLDAPAELRWSRDPDQRVVLSGKLAEVQISPDGTYFAVEYADAPTELRRPSGEVVTLQRAPDDRPSVFISPVRPPSGEVVAPPRAPDDRPSAIISPDGSSVAVHYSDETVELRSSEHLKQSIALPKATSLSFSPKGNYIELYNYKTSLKQLLTKMGQLTLSGYSSVTLSPNDRFILVTYSDRTSELRDTRTGRSVFFPKDSDRLQQYPLFSPSESLLFLSRVDGKSELYTIADSGEITPAPLSFEPYFIHTMAFSPDLSHLILEYSPPESTGVQAFVEITDLKTRDVVTFTVRHAVNTFTFSPDRRYVQVAYQYPEQELRRVDTGETVFAALVDDIEFIPDTAYLMVRYPSQVMELWDGSDLRHLADLGLGLKDFYRNEWRYDSATKRLLIAYSDGRIYELDLNWLQELNSAPTPEDRLRAICWPFNQPGLFDESELIPYLDGRGPLACTD